MTTRNPVSEQTRLPVVCVVGPTASGKSALGVALAKAVNGEVLSADSMQVYRGMDIGTAKLKPDEMEGVPHHLMDLVDPDEPFTVAQWVTRADEVITELHSQGKLPIVVGGTGLYIRAITENLNFANQSGSHEIRDKWQAYLESHGNQALHDALRQRDVASAERLHPNDVRRVVRALEVHELGSGRLSEGYDWSARGGRYQTVLLGLTMDREALYRRVDTRVDAMMADGLYDEVRGLLQRGYTTDLTSMQAIGYKELAQAITGEMSIEQAVDDIKRATRRYVKRQLSWFRRDERIEWFDVNPVIGISEANLQSCLTIVSTLSAGIHVPHKE